MLATSYDVPRDLLSRAKEANRIRNAGSHKHRYPTRKQAPIAVDAMEYLCDYLVTLQARTPTLRRSGAQYDVVNIQDGTRQVTDSGSFNRARDGSTTHGGMNATDSGVARTTKQSHLQSDKCQELYDGQPDPLASKQDAPPQAPVVHEVTVSTTAVRSGAGSSSSMSTNSAAPGKASIDHCVDRKAQPTKDRSPNDQPSSRTRQASAIGIAKGAGREQRGVWIAACAAALAASGLVLSIANLVRPATNANEHAMYSGSDRGTPNLAWTNVWPTRRTSSRVECHCPSRRMLSSVATRVLDDRVLRRPRW